MEWIIGGILAVYVAAAGYLTSQQEAFIFPQVVNKLNPAQLDASHYTTLKMSDGTVLSGAVYPAKNSQTLVLTFGGNAHDVTGFAHFMANTVFNQHVNVAGFSYRGYPNVFGKSAGKPSQAALYADALNIYDAMVAQFQPQKVVVVGYSLGTAVASYVATQRPVQAVGLVTPFTSMVDLAQEQYPLFPVRWLLRHPFPVVQQLKPLDVPIHLLFAEQDGLIPTTHSTRLRDAVGENLAQDVTLPATHSNILDHPEAVPFLQQLVQ